MHTSTITLLLYKYHIVNLCYAKLRLTRVVKRSYTFDLTQATKYKILCILKFNLYI